MTGLMDDPPVACTLGASEHATQAARWKALQAGAGIERVPTEDGLRVSFRRDPAVERELRELVAVEVECCRWADWRVETGSTAVALEVSSTGEGIAVIHGWLVSDTFS
jgi:MerR family transcriptional regulator, copper efflux regulator